MSRNATRDDARIGDFVLEGEIGKGSFATVYRGYRMTTKEPVAIKVVVRKKLTPKLLDNLEGEIAILKAIDHPNIVELKECLKTDSHIYLVMAFCSAGDLSQYIRKRYDIFERSANTDTKAILASKQTYPHPQDGGLNETVVRSILSQLAAALEFMRARDIVHRDIKPQNLLLQPPESDFVALGNSKQIPQVKVADFGFARHLSNNVLAETLCGSPLYMAPEILRYEKYDAKADLWSVGAVLYEMSVGKAPFKANNHVELLRRIEKGEDRIKFPDERSPGSLAREAARRQEAGEPPLLPPHPVTEDIKTLIRQLLHQKPVERMSFDEFFKNPVIESFRASLRPSVPPSVMAEISDKPAKGSTSNSTTATSQTEPTFTPAFAKTMAPPSNRPADGHVSVTNRKEPDSGAARSERTAAASAPIQALSSPPPPPPTTTTTPAATTNTPSTTAQQAEMVRRSPTLPRSFASKYVVGDVVTYTSSPKSESKRLNTKSVDRRGDTHPENDSAAGSPNDVSLPTPGSSTSHLVPQPDVHSSKPDLARDDDSLLGKEYVMVEKRTVEVNALADELAASPQHRSSSITRRTSRLARLSSGIASNPIATSEASPIRISSTPPGALWPTAGPFALPPGSRPSSFVRRTSLSSSGSPSPRLTVQTVPLAEDAGIGQSVRPSPENETPTAASTTYAGGTTTIAVGGAAACRSVTHGSSPVSNTPSSALARAISMASLRLFGVPSGMSLRDAAALVRSRSSRRSALVRSGDTMDEAEANLLTSLEDLGQKSFVLSEFADSKLAAFFPVGPHQSSADLDSSTATGISPNRGNGFGSLGHASLSRRMSSTSSTSSALDPVAAENAAAEALVLYVKCLTFLQRAINLTKAFLESRSKPGNPAVASAELNEVVQWLRARFNEGYDKADFARSKCGEIPECAQHVDKLIFDKAVEVARAAAMDELENNREGSGWDPNQCLLAYETASSMLMSLLDPGEDAMSLSENSIAMVEKYVKSINKRIVVLQNQFTCQAPSQSQTAANLPRGGVLSSAGASATALARVS